MGGKHFYLVCGSSLGLFLGWLVVWWSSLFSFLSKNVGNVHISRTLGTAYAMAYLHKYIDMSK